MGMLGKYGMLQRCQIVGGMILILFCVLPFTLGSLVPEVSCRGHGCATQFSLSHAKAVLHMFNSWPGFRLCYVVVAVAATYCR